MRALLTVFLIASFSVFASAFPSLKLESRDVDERNKRPDNVGSIQGIPYTTDLIGNADGTYTGKFAAVALGYANCSAIRAWATTEKLDGFCDGLKLYDQETKISYHGNCISAYNAVADSCVRFFDDNYENGKTYEFKFEYTGKVNNPPAASSSSLSSSASSSSSSTSYQPVKGGNDKKPNLPVSLSLTVQPYLDEEKDTVELSVIAYSWANCTYIRSLANKEDQTGICNGLPLWVSKENRGPSELCINLINEVADKCIKAFDEGKKEYHFFVSVKAKYFPEWAKKFPKKPTGEPTPSSTSTTPSSSGAAPSTGGPKDLTIPATGGCPSIETKYDAAAKTGTMKSSAKTYGDCTCLRAFKYYGNGTGFCDGLPQWDAATGRSLLSECTNGVDKTADACVSAVDKGQVPYAFYYTFSVSGTTAVPAPVNSPGPANTPSPSPVVVKSSMGPPALAPTLTSAVGDAAATKTLTTTKAAAATEKATSGTKELEKNGATVVYTNKYNDARSAGYIDLIAKSEEDCKYIERHGSEDDGKYKAFCSGLEDEFYGKCTQAFHDVAKVCTTATKAGKFYNFYVMVDSTTKTVSLANPNPPSSSPTSETPKASIRVFERPAANAVGIFAADAVSYDDCMRFERMATVSVDGRDAFCGGEVRGECVRAFREAGDGCLKAFDEKKDLFRFDVRPMDY
ncbi:hypothetical protein HDU97_008899 [Phlyctochytrium planicorne]|nr:hypothetical protein HDU97_008899 [Phlyctochytrium planicorne]